MAVERLEKSQARESAKDKLAKLAASTAGAAAAIDSMKAPMRALRKAKHSSKKARASAHLPVTGLPFSEGWQEAA